MNEWVLARLDPNEGDDVDWESFNIGLVEDGVFRTVFTCFSEEDARYALAAFRWFDTFKDGVIADASIPQRPKKRTSRRRLAD